MAKPSQTIIEAANDCRRHDPEGEPFADRAIRSAARGVRNASIATDAAGSTSINKITAARCICLRASQRWQALWIKCQGLTDWFRRKHSTQRDKREQRTRNGPTHDASAPTGSVQLPRD